MIYKVPEVDLDAPFVVIDIGNTSTTIATSHEGSIKTPLAAATDDHDAFAEAYASHTEAMPKGKPGVIVIGSVVPDALEWVATFIAEREDRNALVVGDALPFPIDVVVKDAKAIGVDRVCAAAAAYERIQGACTVIDFGTAVTVDLVDEDGALRGGAILPGLRLQLRALHEHTAALPEVEPGWPDHPYGRDTTEAMQTGVCRGMAGAVRALVESYATAINRWPQVIATGGDVVFMAPHCDFLDTTVEHLTLVGISLAFTKHLEGMGA